MTLNELQSIGALSTTLGEVSFDKAVPLSVILGMSKSEQAEFDGAVVVDDCAWVATVRKTPIDRAKVIHCCSKDGKLGQYRRDSRTYYYKELLDGSLTTTNLFKLEEKRMANMNLDIDMASLEADMKSMGMEAGTAPATGFEDAAAPAASADGAKRVNHVAIHNRLVAEARKKAGGGAIVNRMDNIINNQLNGRLLAFITKTDSVTKAAIQQTKDKAGNVIAKDVVFKNARPGQIKGIIVATPAGSEVALTKLTQQEAMIADSKNTTMELHFMGIESAYTYLATNYDGKIRESEAVLGDKASEINVKVKAAEKDGETTIKSQLVLANKDKRNSLLVEGNYYPIRAYKTLSTVDMSAEDAAIADLNVKALFKEKTKYEDLSDASKANVQESGDSVTTTWFDKGAAITVKRYDDKDANVTDVRVPVRTAKVTKSGTVQYKFEYSTPEEIVASTKYEKIVKATGLSQDTILRKMKPFSARKSSGSSKDELTMDDYLRMVMSKKISVNGKVGGFEDAISEIAADASIR